MKIKAVQIPVHNNRRCLCVPRVPGSVKNPHKHNNDMWYIKSDGGLATAPEMA